MSAATAPSAGEATLLSVIIPCYNDRDTVLELVRRVRAAPVDSMEIIVVDDFSTDGTREIVRQYVAQIVDKVIYHDRNRGKGAALRSGIREAKGRIAIVQDADLEYDPKDYARLIDPILNHGADVVYGSRFAGEQAHRAVYFWHMVANRFLTFLSNCFTGLYLTDVNTCYKVFRREVLESIEIEEDGFGFDPEVTAKIAKQGRVVCEVGISYFGRTYEEGKKIGLKDGVRALYAILKYSLFR